MKRITTVALVLLFAILAQAGPRKERTVKVYLHIPDVGYGESYAFYLQKWMEMADEENDGYKIVWEAKASDAEFIISIVMNKDPDVSIIKLKGGAETTCNKFIAVTQLWKRGSGKIYEAQNVQADCDPNAIAERAAEAMERAMGLKATGGINGSGNKKSNGE